MDDLISRSAVTELIKSKCVDGALGKEDTTLIDAYELLGEVLDIPTAYNVDKVVEEIENIKDLDNREQHCAKTKELDKCGDFDDCEQCILEKAISFVKAGGVNES